MKIDKKIAIIFAVIAVLAFTGGFFLGGSGDDRPPSTRLRPGGFAGQALRPPPSAPSATAKVWTCSMHPQIRNPGPGQCPICGMDLIPVTEDASDEMGPRELKLSATARRLAQIEVVPAERRAVSHDVRMVGTIEYDETRLATITAWVGGRLDRLYVDYTGISVRPGDHMVYMYSPDIFEAQEELIQAKKAIAEMAGSHIGLVLEIAEANLAAIRDKLRLWGLTQDQIRQIEDRGTPEDHIEINAPIGGIVVHMNVVEGMYVKTGTPIYRIADLSQVWVKLDAYESDLSWLHYGQEVEFASEAHPGETFTGRIAFIAPILTRKTRTVKVRVTVPNPDGKLKPGMFVKAIVRAQLAKGGKVIAPDLAGKWISPMHPEIVKDEPGPCDICGMPLVRAKDLGYQPAESSEPPLVIPASAPLLTGKRAVVYVQSATDESRFEGREVTLGPRAGDYYIVEAGLEAGENVVVNGNFKIDSALQILARPSMMSPPAEGEKAGGSGKDGPRQEETR